MSGIDTGIDDCDADATTVKTGKWILAASGCGASGCIDVAECCDVSVWRHESDVTSGYQTFECIGGKIYSTDVQVSEFSRHPPAQQLQKGIHLLTYDIVELNDNTHSRTGPCVY
jgi:hypothetical protein